MASEPIVLHSTLSPEAVADTLLRSIDKEMPGEAGMPSWFIQWTWISGSRNVRGLIDGNTCRLKRRTPWRWSPNFYGKWQAEPSGTRIEGYFDLAPGLKGPLCVTLVLVLIMALIGIVMNALDLTVGTHMTKDPVVGLWISIFGVLWILGFYLVANWLGSRRDKGLLDFLEQTLAASRVRW